AGETEETIIYGEVDLAAADNNRVVRIPGQWEFDRIAARRPEMYQALTQAGELVGSRQSAVSSPQQ
ncbi:MAG: hypothetical protein DMG27_21830, partial [Acidobacteria bacterium]